MKRGAFFFCFFLAAAPVAEAHPFAPPTLDYVARSDTVYLIQPVSSEVGPDSVHTAKVTFIITETLRGKERKGITLSSYEGNPYKIGANWIIFHNPTGFKDCVGWAMEGDCEWLPLEVTGVGSKMTAQWVGPLEDVREYLKSHPPKG